MIDETLFEAEEKMEKAVEVAKEDFAGIRTGRANPGMFNKLLVDYYGAPTPLQQLASFQTPEARTILVNPFDKGAMHEIEKTRVSIRNVRRKGKTDLDKAVKDGEVGEDDGSRGEKELEALTRKYVDTVDTLLKGKETELLEV